MQDPIGQKQATPSVVPGRSVATRFNRFIVSQRLPGFFIALLSTFVCYQLMFGTQTPWALAVAGIGGAVLGGTRSRVLVWALGALALIAIVVVGYSPLVPRLMQAYAVQPPLEREHAVVVLGAGLQADGSLNTDARNRLYHGFSILKAGYADRLILPVGADSWSPQARREMLSLGLQYPIDDVGPVANTHDEAIAVARFARQQHWPRVILVTNVWHMPRAAAAFEKAGIHVIRAPCPDSRFESFHPSGFAERAQAFSSWLHETIGYWVYRKRHWID